MRHYTRKWFVVRKWGNPRNPARMAFEAFIQLLEDSDE